eukprot:c4009_g1_i2.p1 GENE.c4009_g1_i2~~c4009_g1_i2.p1  ORF type:complete len:167 (-),score=42.83 c4009_g1_i2:49-549(-)
MSVESVIVECDLGNHIGNEGLRDISVAVRSIHTSLTALGLSDNRITDEGVRYLSSAMQSENCLLKVVELEDNRIGDEGAFHIAVAVQSERCRLSHLFLWGNVMTWCVSDVIYEAVKRHESLSLCVMKRVAKSRSSPTELKGEAKWSDVIKQILAELPQVISKNIRE